MMEKAYSMFLCVLLISVLFLPSTAAGRALLQTKQMEGEGGYHGGNDGNKIGGTGSHSRTASSRIGFSSSSSAVIACPQGSPYRACFPSKRRPVPSCNIYSRRVTANEAYKVEVEYWKTKNKENNIDNY